MSDCIKSEKGMKKMAREACYIAIIAVMGASLLLGFAAETFKIDLGGMAWFAEWATSPVALAIGVVFAFVCGETFPVFNKTMSKRLLQYSVIGLGFGMNVEKALASGSEGMLFTVVSVFGTLALGWVIGRKLLGVDAQTSYLLSSGTAICGGSAIAAVGPTLKAKAESMSVALGVVFILNAVALFVFPPVGDVLSMSAKQFGMWAAIAIHDTSSVVGACAAFDTMNPELTEACNISALEVGTTIKLTRALWIVVIVLLTPWFFKQSMAQANDGKRKPWYKNIPLFIVWFIVAILVNTYILGNSALLGDGASAVATQFSGAVNKLAKHMITLSLFFIGASLTRKTLRSVGLRPLIQGVVLWITISLASLGYILWVG